MISEEIQINQFVQIPLILEAAFVEDPFMVL